MAWGNGRVLQRELLSAADPELAAENLRDLARINRLFGVHRILLGLLRELVSPKERFSVLDVGAASGDLGESVRRTYPAAKVVCMDRCLTHLRSAPQPRVVAEALELPFADRSFDIVFCSLLLHEFPDDAACDLAARLFRKSRRALVVLELLRHPVAYHFLPATKWLLGWGRITLHDGPASVAAGFRVHELRRLALRAGLSTARIRCHLPWLRLSLVARHGRGQTL